MSSSPCYVSCITFCKRFSPKRCSLRRLEYSRHKERKAEDVQLSLECIHRYHPMLISSRPVWLRNKLLFYFQKRLLLFSCRISAPARLGSCQICGHQIDLLQLAVFLRFYHAVHQSTTRVVIPPKPHHLEQLVPLPSPLPYLNSPLRSYRHQHQLVALTSGNWTSEVAQLSKISQSVLKNTFCWSELIPATAASRMVPQLRPSHLLRRYLIYLFQMNPIAMGYQPRESHHRWRWLMSYYLVSRSYYFVWTFFIIIKIFKIFSL